jgi:D-serine deaminase-like pyridoxal phosphate-dependent protein
VSGGCSSKVGQFFVVFLFFYITFRLAVVRLMRNWHSCVGLPIASLETPVLLLDLNTFDCNNRQMHQLVEQRKVTWRAHAKAHKSSALAVEQVKSGAIGVLVQKLGEAEVMVAGGVKE